MSFYWKKGIILKFFFSFFFFLLFFLFFSSEKTFACNLNDPGYQYRAKVGSCGPTNCPGVLNRADASYVKYYCKDLNGHETSSVQLEYFPLGQGCPLNGPRSSYYCTGGCTSDSDCGEGICAGGDAEDWRVCSGGSRGTKPYWCQGWNCGWQCNWDNYTCNLLKPPEGLGGSQSTACNSCVAPTPTPLPTATPTPTADPTCSITGFSSTAKTVTLDGSNLQVNGLDRYAVETDKGNKSEVIPPEDQTISFSEIANPTTVTVKAWSTSGRGAVLCGTRNISSSTCQIGVTPCTAPNGSRDSQCGGDDGNPGVCQDGVCASCDVTTETCEPKLDYFDVKCEGTRGEGGKISFKTTPSWGLDTISFKIKNPATGGYPCSFQGMRSQSAGGSSYNLYWGANACGTAANVSNVDTATTSDGIRWSDIPNGSSVWFDSSVLRRGLYKFDNAVGGFWLSNGSAGAKCDYSFNCNGTPGNWNVPGGTLRNCEINYGDGKNYVIAGTALYTCSDRDEITMIFNTAQSSGKGQGRLMYPETNLGVYKGNADLTKVQTYLCAQVDGTGTNNVASSLNSGRSNGTYDCSFTRAGNFHTFSGIPGTSNKTWKGTIGNDYIIEMLASPASGNPSCSVNATTRVTCKEQEFSISGQVYKDRDGDGFNSVSTGGPDLAYDGTKNSYQISITSPWDDPADSTTTKDLLGNYTIEGLLTGDYTIKLKRYPEEDYRVTSPANFIRSATLGPNRTGKNFGLAPYRRISGNILVDTDKNGEPNRNWDPAIDGTEDFSISVSGGVGVEYSTRSLPAGTFTIQKATAGNPYTVTFAAPAGYRVVNTPNSNPGVRSYAGIQVGWNSTTCQFPAGAIEFPGYEAYCGSAGAVENLNFVIQKQNIWTQGKGGDMRNDDGYRQRVPQNLLALLDGDGGTPGVIYSGGVDANFCSGEINSPCMARSSSKTWVAGNNDFPGFSEELFDTSVINVGYDKFKALIAKNGQTISPLTCSNYSACTLSPLEGLGAQGGVYEITPTGTGGSMTLNGLTISALDKDFVVFIKGKLTIAGAISVPVSTRSTLTIIASSDINISSSLGRTNHSNTASNLDGIFITDKSFILPHDGNNNCSDSSLVDRRLNVSGSVIANAGLRGGEIENMRDLCSDGISYPSLYIEERPDFLINLPAYLWEKKRIWREVAP